MSDFYATEKIIGGTVFVGISSLLMWSANQSGDGGLPGVVFSTMAVLGSLWVVIGLFELIVDHRWHHDERVPAGEVDGTSH